MNVLLNPCPSCEVGPGEPCRDLRANGPSSGSKALKHPHQRRGEVVEVEVEHPVTGTPVTFTSTREVTDFMRELLK